MGNNLMFFLLAALLLLIMGLLTVCLWWLLLILKQHLDLMEKMGENTGDTGSRVVMSVCPLGSSSKEQEIKPLEEPLEKSNETADPNAASKSEQDIEEHSEEACEDINAKVLEFMRHSSKNNYIHLKAVNKALSSYLEECELVEDPTGKLVMIQSKSGECVVFPESENISEKEYEFCGVKECYETNIPVRSGCHYQIIQILELCMVKRNGDKYIIQSKGKLMLE